jgi:peptidoglycan/LPS O-acetylase OafA/YrhL
VLCKNSDATELYESHGLPSIKTPLMTFLFSAFVLMVVVALASLSYRWIELPARKLIKRL